MDATKLNEYLAFAEELTDRAGKVMEEGFYGAKKVEAKNGMAWDLVTDYDVKVEKLIMDSIREKYPTHLVISEEDSAAKSKKKFELTDAPTWLVDPIDGTYNYAHGLPLTCISMGLAVERQLVLGVVFNPLSSSKYTAIRGQGAFLNGRPIHVSQQEGLKASVASFEISLIRHPALGARNTERVLEIVHLANGIRIIGSAALTLCMVAAGGIDVFVHEYLQPWDLAAGAIILQEAGGYVCHSNGDEFNTMGHTIIAASNKKIADDLLEVFNKHQ